VKYFVLAAVSAAFLLFGMALADAELGRMEFECMTAIGPTWRTAAWRSLA
jgi:NADH:ubiquinone oxidoreductase subunit 2 (subunit N)